MGSHTREKARERRPREKKEKREKRPPFGVKNEKAARELGAAFKPGYPETYTESQTGPVFRESPHGQRQEIERLAYTAGLSYGTAHEIIKRKYEKEGVEWTADER
jgi:hypothetical protein